MTSDRNWCLIESCKIPVVRIILATGGVAEHQQVPYPAQAAYAHIRVY